MSSRTSSARERTIGCFVNFGADYLEPGVVHYGGHGAVVVGELDGKETPAHSRAAPAAQAVRAEAVLTANIWGYLWGKLIYGALLFATALTNEGIADLLAEQRYRPLFTRLAHEVAAVAQAEGVRLEAFNGFDPNAFLPGASRSRDRAFLRRYGRSQPPFGQDAIPASGATSRSASARPRWMRSSGRSSRSAGVTASRRPSPAAPSR